MNWVTVLALFRTLAPAFFIVAEAFKYGMKKHGGETWKDTSASEHVNKAIEKIGTWLTERRASLLADAGLRLLFALCLVVGSTSKAKYVPKEKATEEEIKEQGANAEVTDK